jgi:signal transduction histidine kinase
MNSARLRPSLLVDLAPALALAIVTLAAGRFDRGSLEAATILLVVFPLAARRFWPLPVMFLVAFGAVATATHSESAWIQIAAVALASYSVGERAEDRFQSALIVLGVAAAMTGAFLAQAGDPFLSVVLPFVILVPSWLIGDSLRGRRLEASARSEAAERAMREREARATASASEERRHVARELHDVVAHTVSVMLIQAGAARQVVRTSPDRAEESLLAVEATGREAMAELRSLLGVLNEAGEGAGLAPQPGVDQLVALVDRIRQAGLPTDLEIDGEARSLPASLDVTVYRIVQEALTNALRYAERARTLVHLTYESAQVRVEILDDGPTPTSDAPESSGRGVVGMHERASQVGGRLEAGPRLGGGYAVRAWLPLEPEGT